MHLTMLPDSFSYHTYHVDMSVLSRHPALRPSIRPLCRSAVSEMTMRWASTKEKEELEEQVDIWCDHSIKRIEAVQAAKWVTCPAASQVGALC